MTPPLFSGKFTGKDGTGYHRRYPKIRVGPEHIDPRELWNDDARIRRMKGVKRRQYIRRLKATIARLMDPNDPFGKRRYPSRGRN